MSLNPPLLANGTPAGILGEFFLLERDGIECSIETNSASYGKIVLNSAFLLVTSLRLCVYSRIPSQAGLFSFDIPFRHITEESFEQPFFGANYLLMTVAPVEGGGLTSPCKVKIIFKKGGCGTFLRVFFSLMSSFRGAGASSRTSFLQPHNVQSFLAEQTAYIDPSDPSRLLLTQTPRPQ